MRQVITKQFINEVAANTQDVFESPVIPNGKEIVIRLFGGCIPGQEGASYIALLFGNRLIKAICKEQEYVIPYSIIGNGTDKVRIIRDNKTGASLRMVCWLEAYYDN